MKKKLTLVSVYSHSVKVSAFVYLTPDNLGKFHITPDQASEIFYKETGSRIMNGDTFSIGL